MAKSRTIPVAVAVFAAASATGCTSAAVCSSARATAAAVESTADAAADAFCGSPDAAPPIGTPSGGDGSGTLDPASTGGVTIPAAGAGGSDE